MSLVIAPDSWARRVAVFLAICVLAAAAAGCDRGADNPMPQPRPLRVLRVSESVPGDAASFPGEVRARHETELSFRVPGKLLARAMEVGDRVRKGQLLAQLDPNDYRLAMQSLEAQLAAARADSDFARDDLARYRALLDQNLISPPEYDRHRTLHVTARQRVVALEAQLRQAANQLDYTDLYADRDGVVRALMAETGQVLAAGHPVVKLAQAEEKEVVVAFPEHRVRELEPGQEVAVTLWADGERRFKARVREIAPAADTASRTYAVRATLMEGQDIARLGMTATLWLPPDGRRRLAIPLSLVYSSQNEPGQPRVWLVDEHSHRVRSHPVRMGEPIGGDRVVVTGLSEGQLIASAGVHSLEDGQLVSLMEETTAAGKVAGVDPAGERP